MMRKRRTKPKRFWRRVGMGLGILSGLALVLCILLWAALAHIPGWYDPPYVSDAEYNDVKKAMMATVSRFTDGLPAGRPFELTLTDDQVNRWVAVRADVWPGADEWIPDFIHGPMLVFEEDRVLLGGRVEKDGWQAVASARLSFELTDESITVRLDEVACGSCPLPVSFLASRLEPILTAPDTDVDAMPDPLAQAVRFFRKQGGVEFLTEGVTVPNRLFWKPSERWFHVRSLEVSNGKLRAEIEPLGP